MPTYPGLQIKCNHCKSVNNKYTKSKIYIIISCNTEERIAQNIHIHNSNKNCKSVKQNIYNFSNNNNNLAVDGL